jgi:hypothetical protein
MLLVYRYRIKSLTGLLNSQARTCDFVCKEFGYVLSVVFRMIET